MSGLIALSCLSQHPFKKNQTSLFFLLKQVLNTVLFVMNTNHTLKADFSNED